MTGPGPGGGGKGAVAERRADCVASASGELRFTLGDPAAALVLRLRGSGTEVRLPVSGPTAVLPVTAALAEGRWDAYAEPADGVRERLTPGLCDLRGLVDRVPDPDAPVTVRIPYATTRSALSLAVWHRSPHAEAGEVTVQGGRITVAGRLYGARLSASATLEARTDTWYALCPAYVNGTCFTATWHTSAVPAAVSETLPATLGLRPAPDAEPVRVARLLDDIARKEQVFVYPALPLGPSRLRIGYTPANELALRIT